MHAKMTIVPTTTQNIFMLPPLGYMEKITLKSSVIQEELLYIAFGRYHKTSVNHGVCLVTFFSNMKEIWRGTYTKIL